MSRVGKNPVMIPDGVEVQLSGRSLAVKGKLGSLTYTVPSDVDVKVEGKAIQFTPKSQSKQARALWGTSRATLANMVTGVSTGYSKTLQIVGVGFRAAVTGSNLDLSLGFSHPVKMAIPQGLKVEVKDNTEVTVSGFDRRLVGQFAANVRDIRSPEPYKGKGVRYANENVIMKEGKKK